MGLEYPKMTFESFLNILEKALPAATAMRGDRIGLQVRGEKNQASRFLVSLELNDEVIEEAVKLQADCIVSFHPLIYFPIKEISPDELQGRHVSKLIKKDISFVSVHTLFDAFAEGTSKILCDKLDLRKIDFLERDENYDDRGMGVLAEPRRRLTPEKLLEKISRICMSPLRYCKGKEKKYIEKIAILGGSGSGFIEKAIRTGAEAFITADIGYHLFRAAEGKIALIDPGHYEMEQFVPAALAELLNEILPEREIDFIKTSIIRTNPIRFFPETDFERQQKNYLINNSVQ